MSKAKHYLYGVTTTALLVVVGVVAQGCGLVGVSRLEPGWAAVKIDYAGGGARTNIPAGGFLQYNPVTERIAEYPIGQQSLVMVRRSDEGKASGDDSVEVRVHGIPIHADTTLFWRIDPNRIADMFVLRPSVPLVGKTVNDGIDGIVVRRLVRGQMQDAGALFESYSDVYGGKRQAYVDTVSRSLGCPTSDLSDASNGKDPLQRGADPDTALGREYIICDKFQLGEIYLDEAQQKAVSEQANAATAVQTSLSNKLAAENTAAASAAPILANAKAEADGISARETALANAPHVLQYDVQMAQAQHPALVQGSGVPLVQLPPTTTQAAAGPSPRPSPVASPAGP